MQLKFRIWNKKYNLFGCDNLIHQTGKIFEMYVGHTLVKSDEENLVVQQFTGLLDKNGKEIYEGDIIEECDADARIWEEYDQKGTILTTPLGTVIWQNGLGFNVKRIRAGEVKMDNGKKSTINMSLYDGLYMWDNASYKVVGNIFVNPELLNQ